MTEPTSDLVSAELHHSHRDVSGGWLRPTTFGFMDGLVSNFALIAGVIGGGATGNAVIVTGLAGLAAGASSMASGEFISVSSQAELGQAEIEIERRELERNPEGELLELTRMYEAKGLRPALAVEVARELSVDPAVALDVHVREELGIDADDLPSPYLAAGASFAAFTAGALVPILPFFFGASGMMAMLWLSALGLVVTGSIVSKITATPLWYGASRLLLLGGVAAGITYGIGSLVGVGLS